MRSVCTPDPRPISFRKPTSSKAASVNAKSLLGVLSLGIMKDTTVTLIADGSDEKEAVDALAELIENLDE